MTPAPVIETVESGEALSLRAARYIASRIAGASGRLAISLSGGSTPKRVYELLGAGDLLSPLDWQKVHVFWGDERFVPPDHKDSNFRMALEALIAHVPIPGAQVYPIPTVGLSPEEAAATYEEALQRYYGANMLDPARPLFELTLLGLGEDGHTASLFPRTKALDERSAWVTSVVGAKPETRITLTYPALESSREILFLVSGEKKREILARVLTNDQALPAAPLATRGSTHIFADRAAMGR
ncbi:MAG: 6-phosphogluconolactonase [Beijerinckiaceae bacterium]|nr:6-phosphogluconolactonase [Beijerinckiaceae bacterium]MCI0735851.1 6-phosphogluconolactonase [Beijerinckiaceae bacterium]